MHSAALGRSLQAEHNREEVVMVRLTLRHFEVSSHTVSTHSGALTSSLRMKSTASSDTLEKASLL